MYRLIEKEAMGYQGYICRAQLNSSLNENSRLLPSYEEIISILIKRCEIHIIQTSHPQ